MEAQWLSMLMHIGYLRSLEDSKRVRAACLTYLQNWLIFFYPERQDIVQQVEEIAKDLGGQVEVPHLSWKYSWIKAICGWHLAKRAQLLLPPMRWSLHRLWDKALFRIEQRRLERELRKGKVGRLRATKPCGYDLS